MARNDEVGLLKEICLIGIAALVDICRCRPEVLALLRHLSRRLSVLVSDALKEERLRQQRLKNRGP